MLSLRARQKGFDMRSEVDHYLHRILNCLPAEPADPQLAVAHRDWTLPLDMAAQTGGFERQVARYCIDNKEAFASPVYKEDGEIADAHIRAMKVTVLKADTGLRCDLVLDFGRVYESMMTKIFEAGTAPTDAQNAQMLSLLHDLLMFGSGCTRAHSTKTAEAMVTVALPLRAAAQKYAPTSVDVWAGAKPLSVKDILEIVQRLAKDAPEAMLPAPLRGDGDAIVACFNHFAGVVENVLDTGIEDQMTVREAAAKAVEFLQSETHLGMMDAAQDAAARVEPYMSKMPPVEIARRLVTLMSKHREELPESYRLVSLGTTVLELMSGDSTAKSKLNEIGMGLIQKIMPGMGAVQDMMPPGMNPMDILAGMQGSAGPPRATGRRAPRRER